MEELIFKYIQMSDKERQEIMSRAANTYWDYMYEHEEEWRKKAEEKYANA